MTSKELKRMLDKLGATYATTKGGHLKVFLNGKQSVIPQHGKAEIGEGLLCDIKKQLDVK